MFKLWNTLKATIDALHVHCDGISYGKVTKNVQIENLSL
jgi:hypothetical protein